MKKYLFLTCLWLLMIPSIILADNNVAKIGDTEYATIKEAIDASQKGDDIVIISDFDEIVEVTNDKEILINLNGHTGNIDIDNYGNLTIYGTGTLIGKYGVGERLIDNKEKANLLLKNITI